MINRSANCRRPGPPDTHRLSRLGTLAFAFKITHCDLRLLDPVSFRNIAEKYSGEQSSKQRRAKIISFFFSLPSNALNFGAKFSNLRESCKDFFLQFHTHFYLKLNFERFAQLLSLENTRSILILCFLRFHLVIHTSKSITRVYHVTRLNFTARLLPLI